MSPGPAGVARAVLIPVCPRVVQMRTLRVDKGGAHRADLPLPVLKLARKLEQGATRARNNL